MNKKKKWVIFIVCVVLAVVGFYYMRIQSIAQQAAKEKVNSEVRKAVGHKAYKWIKDVKEGYNKAKSEDKE